MKKMITKNRSKLAALMLGLALMMTAAFALTFGGGAVKTANAATGFGPGTNPAIIPGSSTPWMEVLYDIPNDETNKYRVNAFLVNGGVASDLQFLQLELSGPFYSDYDGGIIQHTFYYSVSHYPTENPALYFCKPIDFAMASNYTPYPATSPDYVWGIDSMTGDFDYHILPGEEYTITSSVYTNTAPTTFIPLTFKFCYMVEPVALPPDPTMEHHDFSGWYMDENFTVAYAGQPIYEHTPLYAKFTPKIYRISYVTGVPNMTYPQKQVTALTAAGTLPTPNRTGYTFTGWFLDSGRTQPYVAITSMTGNITLYAGFDAILLTITFYVKGEVYTTVEVPYGSSLSAAVAAAQTDAEILTALYSDPNLYNALSVNTVLTGNMNVHAELGTGVDTSIGFFGRVGAWFASSWIWLVVCAALILAAVAAVLIVKKRQDNA